MNKLVEKLYTLSPQKVYRYFAQQSREANTRRLVSSYISKNQYRRLHLGCGGNLLPGWLNSDLIPHNRTVAKIDASKRFPIPDNTFDVVYSEHLFEHLDIQGQLNYLSECKRILKPGGKIRIATPDFDFLLGLTDDNISDLQKKHLHFNAQHFLKKVPIEVLQENYPVYVINNYVRDWGHQLIHNKKSLENLMNYAGFSKITYHNVGKSNEPSFVDIERHFEMIGVDLNNLETMILEASV